ncbi:MAG TPA: 50S ribosomal protein L10 [Bryobacteraceae bacterium]|nr:50S ribosomal protein L10 [Bryobacteraceae bacterium]
MKDRDQKAKDLEALRKELEQQPSIFIAGYEKMTVSQDYDLRKTVRGAGGNYKVVKNNLAAKASEELPSKDVLGNLKGMTSLALTQGDPVQLAKALVAYAKTNPSFTFKAGFVEGRAVEVKSIQDLATMPSKEELIAKVMFLINSSAQRLAVSMSGVARNLAVVLDQAIKENKFQS